MKKISLYLSFLFVGISIMLSAWRSDDEQAPIQYLSEEKSKKSLAAFNQMLKVIRHPRCMNCHPSDDRPRQGDDAHVHQMNVQRGKDDKGLPVLRCNSCHQSENNNYSDVPGAPKWHLAPKSMSWQGLSDARIGEAILNKSKNGRRDVKALVEHMTKDSLVLWAWAPGEGRQLPPLSQSDFAKFVKEWADNGAVIPK
jgi:hypothetical protein